ncbi:hypothetical protein EZV62_014765 [Acer yangbiense]|uniref:CCR4-NOT transcription complex subunit 11 n=1 Tax=Acer yangbiense TaxID=1000413 RepID=A0A5C7HVH6_9ROSI|nr:hypothetical protein EZV62_014765 [Acer yangbiense]
MLSQEESGRVFSLLKSEHRPVEEIVSDFTSKFPRHHHFAICYSLLLLFASIPFEVNVPRLRGYSITTLVDKKALNSTERLVAFAILHQAYSSQKSSANPFISLIINTSCDDEAEKYERAFILQLLSSGTSNINKERVRPICSPQRPCKQRDPISATPAMKNLGLQARVRQRWEERVETREERVSHLAWRSVVCLDEDEETILEEDESGGEAEEEIGREGEERGDGEADYEKVELEVLEEAVVLLQLVVVSPCDIRADDVNISYISPAFLALHCFSTTLPPVKEMLQINDLCLYVRNSNKYFEK